jgi:hypothetical protein
VKRAFWVALGLGAGATGAVLAGRWTRKQAQRVAPQTLAREAKGGIMDLGKLFSESIAEGRRAMGEREVQLRRTYDLGGSGGSAEDAPTDAPADAGPTSAA